MISVRINARLVPRPEFNLRPKFSFGLAHETSRCRYAVPE